MAEPYEESADRAYGLDPEHIRGVCEAETDDASFTMVERPARMFVSSRHRIDDIWYVLGRVGYDVEPRDPATVVVHGWSSERLTVRVTALRATVDRLTETLPGTPGKAVDVFAVRYGEPDLDSPRYKAACQVRDLLRHDVQAVTGPHVPYDDAIAAVGADFEELRRSAQRLEMVVDDLIARHWMTAVDTIETYCDLRHYGATHLVARADAISCAVATINDANERVAEADRLPDHGPQAATSAERPHPVALAATDHATDGTGATTAEPAAPSAVVERRHGRAAR
jgi:hypothetical protein